MISKGEATKRRILEAGLLLARIAGLRYVGARRIAAAVNMTAPAVLYHFGSTVALRNAVADYAVQQKDALVMARLILDNHPAVASLSDEDRTAVLLVNR